MTDNLDKALDLLERIAQSLRSAFSGTLTSVAGNARLATDDIATEVGRLRDQPGEGVVSIGGAAWPRTPSPRT